MVVGADVPEGLEGLFEADLARSVELSLEGLARRGPLGRVLDRLAALAVRYFV